MFIQCSSDIDYIYFKADFHLTFFVRVGVAPKSEHAKLKSSGLDFASAVSARKFRPCQQDMLRFGRYARAHKKCQMEIGL